MMVRLEAAACRRMAGRATLVVEAAMDEARREARTRVEAIVIDGGERIVWRGQERTVMRRGGKKDIKSSWKKLGVGGKRE